MNINIKLFICYYDFDKIKNTCKWLLTENEIFAKETDQSFKLASIEDLYHCMAATNKVFNDVIITVVEGNCKYYEYEYIDFCGKTDWKCGYELLWD